jgi:hypothetical protein
LTLAHAFYPRASGYPARIWDKKTGVVNKDVANYWKENFDLQYILQRDWNTKGLGAKLQGKIHIYVGQSDTYYLNDAGVYPVHTRTHPPSPSAHSAVPVFRPPLRPIVLPSVYYMEDFLKKTKNPHYDGVVEFGSHDGRGYEHCWSGDNTVTNSIGRLTINERVIPQMVKRMIATAPKGADTTSWRY